MDSFIVQLWAALLFVLGWVSPLQLIWCVAPKTRAHGWVDVWVLLNLALAAVALVCGIRLGSSPIVATLVILYGAIRILEMVVYQAKVVLFEAKVGLFDPLLTPQSAVVPTVRSYRRVVVLVLHNYLEAVVWFAAIYAVLKINFNAQCVLSTEIGALYYSLVTMATLGYGDIAPTTDTGRFIVFIHLVVAVFMSLVILARFVGLLPPPQSLEETEDGPPKP